MKKTLFLPIFLTLFSACQDLRFKQEEDYFSKKTKKRTETFPIYQNESQPAKEKIIIKRNPQKNDAIFILEDSEIINTKEYILKNKPILDAIEKFNNIGNDRYKIIKRDTEKFYSIYKSLEKEFLNSSLVVFDSDITNFESYFYGYRDEKTREFIRPKNHFGISLNRNSRYSDDNLLKIDFWVAEPSFYAGYLAAKYIFERSDEFDNDESPGLKITAIGSDENDSNIGYMAGFQQGVKVWNSTLKTKDKRIEFVKLGNSVDDHFTKSEKIGDGKEIAKKLTDKNVDVVLSANGAQIIDILDHVEDVGSNMLFVGTDIDIAEQYYNHSDKVLTSITKNYDELLTKAIATIYGDEDNYALTIGSRYLATMDDGYVSFGNSSANKISQEELFNLKNDKNFVNYVDVILSKLRFSI